MTRRPNSPDGTATEILRVAVMSDEELAESAAFSIIEPSAMPQMKVWLRVDQATNPGTFTLPDAMGGASATQATAARQPTIGTTTNGLAKLTVTDDCLSLPISAGLTDENYFGIGLWIKPLGVSASDDIFGITTGGGASANRCRFSQTTDDIVQLYWVPPAPSSNVRSARSASTRNLLQAGVWKFVMAEFHADLVGGNDAQTEALRNRMFDNGVPFPAPHTIEYAQSAGTAPAPGPAKLVPAVTGNAILFARTTAGGNPFVGDIGPDIFFYDPRTLTQLQRVQMAQYRVPIG